MNVKKIEYYNEFPFYRYNREIKIKIKIKS